MKWDPRDLVRGSLIVATRDFRSNARGVKVWIISGLTLLAILAASFGITQLAPGTASLDTQYVLWASAQYPANNSSAGVVAWVSDYLGAPRVGQTVVVASASSERARAVTNSTGWVRFPGLGPGAWRVRIASAPQNVTYAVDLDASRPTQNLTVLVRRFDLLGDGAQRDVSFQAVWVDGTPVPGAAVLRNQTAAGVTDQNGFLHLRLVDGAWGIAVTARGATVPEFILVQSSPFSIIPFLKGPDALLLFLGVGLMGLFAPIIAIAMSYDAVAKERMQGSLEILLARPASRTGIAIGKFLGSFLSVGLPMVGVLLGAIVGVAGASGKWPDPTFALAFVAGTLGLVAVYVLIMEIFSTLAKSAGTAILSALVVWIVFNIVWNLVVLAVQAVFHIESATPAAFTVSAVTSLFNPNGVYSLTVTTFAPPSALGLFGTTGGGILPDWSGPVAMFVWILILLVAAVFVFRKRIV